MVTEDTPGDRRLAHTAGSLVAVVGQAIREGPGGLLRRIGTALRDVEAMPFLDALMLQVRDLVPEARVTASDTRQAFGELVDDLDREVPDKDRLEILRRAFLAVAMGDQGDPGGTMGLVFLQTARKLTGVDARVLASFYAFDRARTESWRGPVPNPNAKRLPEPALRPKTMTVATTKHGQEFAKVANKLGRKRFREGRTFPSSPSSNG